MPSSLTRGYGEISGLGACLSLLAAVAPVQLPLLAAAWALVGITVLVGLAVGEFHRRAAA